VPWMDTVPFASAVDFGSGHKRASGSATTPRRVGPLGTAEAWRCWLGQEKNGALPMILQEQKRYTACVFNSKQM